MRKTKVTDAKIVEVYEKKGCNISATCIALDINRTTFYKRREKSEKLHQQLTDVEESLIDYTESKLLEQIQDGNMTAIIFHLKTKGKKRGYIETTEIEEHRTTDIDMSKLSDEEINTMTQILSKTKPIKQ